MYIRWNMRRNCTINAKNATTSHEYAELSFVPRVLFTESKTNLKTYDLLREKIEFPVPKTPFCNKKLKKYNYGKIETWVIKKNIYLHLLVKQIKIQTKQIYSKKKKKPKKNPKNKQTNKQKQHVECSPVWVSLLQCRFSHHLLVKKIIWQCCWIFKS